MLTCSNITFCFLESSGISVLIFSDAGLVDSPDPKPANTEDKQLCWWEWFSLHHYFFRAPPGEAVVWNKSICNCCKYISSIHCEQGLSSFLSYELVLRNLPFSPQTQQLQGKKLMWADISNMKISIHRKSSVQFYFSWVQIQMYYFHIIIYSPDPMTKYSNSN